MNGELWNIGAKVADVDAEAAFFVSLGGRLLLREKFATPDGEANYALVAFGGTRLFLTPKTIFEGVMPQALHYGLTHAVFEVESLEPEIERLNALGTEMLLPPTDIEAGFGKRRITFFRSPGGIVFEVMEITEDSKAVE